MFFRWLLVGSVITTVLASCDGRSPLESDLGTVSSDVRTGMAFERVLLPVPAGARSAFPRAINDAGDIVGEATYAPPNGLFYTRAVLWRNGKVFELGVLGGRDSRAVAVNNRGEVVGTSDTNEAESCFSSSFFGEICFYVSHAFRWKDGVLEDLGVPGHWSSADAVSDAGGIAGSSSVTGTFATLWSGKGMEVFGAFGGQCTYSFGSGVNATGTVVGQSTTDAGVHAFSWNSNRGATDLGTLGGPQSWAIAINERGDIVGTSDTDEVLSCVTNQWGTFCNYASHPFLWRGGRMIDLGTLGGKHSAARAVNDAGEAVGESETPDIIRCWADGGLEDCTREVHAVLWRDGEVIDLGKKSERSFATGINRLGQIVGWVASAGPVMWSAARL